MNVFIFLWLICKVSFTVLVQFSCSVLSDSLRPRGLQHARLPCPSPAPGIYSNSRPLSWWCHPTISFSVIPFSSCPQSLPASGYFHPWSVKCFSLDGSLTADSWLEGGASPRPVKVSKITPPTHRLMRRAQYVLWAIEVLWLYVTQLVCGNR